MVTLCRKRFNINNYPYNAHTKHWLVLYGTKDKELTFPHGKLANFFSRDGVCLQRGTNWNFKYNSG